MPHKYWSRKHDHPFISRTTSLSLDLCILATVGNHLQLANREEHNWFTCHQLFLTQQKIVFGLVTNFLCRVLMYGTGDSAKWSMQVTVNKNRAIEIKQWCMQETSHLEICHENASLGYYSVINCIRKESCKKGNCIVAMFILHFLDCHNFS